MGEVFRPATISYEPNVNHPVVLVRLSRIHRDALRGLLGMAWRFVTAKTLGGNRAVRNRRTVEARKR
jgi:hypothetical protein